MVVARLLAAGIGNHVRVRFETLVSVPGLFSQAQAQ